MPSSRHTLAVAIDDGCNDMSKPNCGHLLPVKIVTDPIPWRDPSIAERLKAAVKT